MYKTIAGIEPFARWMEGLRDKIADVAITKRIDRARRGNFGNTRHVGKDILSAQFYYEDFRRRMM
jgi:putative addiction module killer protein